MNVEKKEITRVVENEYTITLNEEQAMILAYIMGNIAVVLPWKSGFIDRLYSQLYDMIGSQKLEEFKKKNKPNLAAYFND